MKVASSIVLGKQAAPELAARAVTAAMQKADLEIASSVLLLLTSEFANNPQEAIKAAAKAANCMQVMGCSATGIFTEEEWVLDSPAAAAMVFGEGVALELPKHNEHGHPLLTLSAPNAIDSSWLDLYPRYGGISGDAVGRGPFSVWQHAKGEVAGYVEACVSGVNIATGTSHGLQLLTQPQLIQKTQGFDIIQLTDQAPLHTLQQAWKTYSNSDEPVPLHKIIVLYADDSHALSHGNFNQTTLISHDEAAGSITLAKTLQAGQYLCWSLRETAAAEADIGRMVCQLTQQLEGTPDFALLFSCLGRGPYFYNGIDRDLNTIKKICPGMPLLGFYGNGQIANIHGSNQLLPYSAVLSLFKTAS